MIHKSNLDNDKKKAINQQEINNNTKSMINQTGEMLVKEGIKEENIKAIDYEDFYKEKFGIIDLSKESIIYFPVYNGKKENNKNDNIFIKRINILEYLELNGIVKISNFNFLKEIINIQNSEDEFMNRLYLDYKENLINKYGKKIANRQLKGLKGKEKYLQTLIFEKKNITKLLSLIKEADVLEFVFRDSSLFYGGKSIYPLIEFSDRYIFIELLFSKPVGKYFHIRDIFNKLEGGDKFYLSETESKKIYNLKDKINNRILKETGIKKYFSLGEGENKGKIYRKY